MCIKFTVTTEGKLFMQNRTIFPQVICTLGETLEPFDSDGAIPAFGFGDAYTKDHSVFSLRPEVCDARTKVLRLFIYIFF